MAKKFVKAKAYIVCQMCKGSGKQTPVPEGGEEQDCQDCDGEGKTEVGWIEIPIPILAEVQVAP